MESLTSGTMAGTGSFRCRGCGYMLTLTGTDTLVDCPCCGGRDFARASLFGVGGLGRERLTGAGRSTPYAASAFSGPAARASHAGSRPARTGAGRIFTRPPVASMAPDLDVAREALDASHARDAGMQPREADTLSADLARSVAARLQPVDGEAWLERVRTRLRDPGEYLAYQDGRELRTVPLTREWTRIGRSLAADIRFDDPTVSRRHALIVRQADGAHVLDDRSLNGVFVNGSRIEGSGIAQRALRDGDEIVVGRYRLRFISIPT